jgi:hypothetical protein
MPIVGAMQTLEINMNKNIKTNIRIILTIEFPFITSVVTSSDKGRCKARSVQAAKAHPMGKWDWFAECLSN